MADKGWTARVAAAAGAAAGTGAAQLGLGYGLGVVVWPVAETPDDSVWLGSLGWATWIAASATVFGAVIASRLGGGPAPGSRGPWRLALATSAAAGALVAVALIALPARSAVRADTFSPHVIAGGYAMVGLVLGLVVAYWAVASRPVAANLITTAAWLWALATSAIVVELTMHRSSATYLTSWQFADPGTDHRYGTIFWPSAALTLAAAFLIGVVSVIPAARRGDLGLGAATSGAVGPLLVAAAFFVLAPQLTGALGPLESAYLIAPYAVLSGLAGSALTVALAQAAANRRARKAERRTAREAEPVPASATGVAIVPGAEAPGTPALAAPKTGPAPAPPKGRAKLSSQIRAKPAPSASAGHAPAGDQGDPAGPETSAGSSALPSSSASSRSATPPKSSAPASPAQATPAPQQATPGSAKPAPPAPTHTARPWETAPGAKPPRSGLSGSDSAKSGTKPAAADQSRSGAAQAAPPASDQPRAGTTQPASSPSRVGTAQPASDQSRAGTSRANQPASGSAQTMATDQSRGGPTPAPAPQTGSGSAPAGPADGDSYGVDPEIAAAARPRGRAKKATPPKSPAGGGDNGPKSTVTPPPSAPTVAQINPKPEKAD